MLALFLGLIFPLQGVLIWFTKYADKQSGCRWQRIKAFRPLIVIHKANKAQQSVLYWLFFVLIWFLGISYLYIHWRITYDPDNILTTGSLQTLSNADFEVVRQFLQRWVALGWVLMLFSVVFFLDYLGKGFAQLKNSTVKTAINDNPPVTDVNNEAVIRGETYRPQLLIFSYENSPSKTKRFTDSLVAPANTKVHLSKQAAINTGAELGKEPPLIIFEYRDITEEPHQVGWWCVKNSPSPRSVFLDEDKLDSKKPQKLSDFHWFRWTVDRNQTYWCKVIVR